MLTSFVNSPLPGTSDEVEAGLGVSVLQQYLCCCPDVTVPASYQYYTLWRIPGAVLQSRLVQTVGQLPRAGAGEGVAGCLSIVAATRGQPWNNGNRDPKKVLIPTTTPDV